MKAIGIRCVVAGVVACFMTSAAVAQVATPPASNRAGRARGTLPQDTPGRDAYWGVWPTSDPKIVGTRLVQNLVSRPPIVARGMGVGYADACTAFGSLRFAQAIGDKALADKVVQRYALITTPEGRGAIPPTDHVDRNVFGIVPFEMYRYTKDPAYLAIGKTLADTQWQPPVGREPAVSEKENMDKGLSFQTRFWIDDMYMITSLQAQAFRATGDKVYLDRAATAMVAYLERLQKPNGLFFHGEDAQFYWGRGNGWVAAGMTELLSELPVDHPKRPPILEAYKKMMEALLKHQAADGMWLQLIDMPDSWPETSCTGMFTFSMATGVRRGWLAEDPYKPAVRKAWIALTRYLDDNANMTEICIGTNKGDTKEHYMTRARAIGDMHGQAATIWAAWAMAAIPTNSQR